MHFAMAERGSAFATRDRGIRLLADLESAEAEALDDDELILDFDGVNHVSKSFADEFLGTVFTQRQARGQSAPELTGLKPFVEKVIDRAMQIRGIELDLRSVRA